MWTFLLISICVAQCSSICQNIFPIDIPKLRTPISAVWDDDTQSLYFVNLRSVGQESSIFRYSPRDGVLYSAYVEGIDSIPFILPVKSKHNKKKNLFAVAYGSQVLTIKWNGKSNRATIVDNNLFSIDSNVPGAKAAKSITDPRGRFYGGSQYREYCSASREDVLSVYRFDKYDGLTRLFGDTKLTSGLAFNEDARKMYHLGSCKLIITEFDWDPHTGNICNGRIVFDFQAHGYTLSSVLPFELAVDTDGFLYTVLQSGSVWVIDPWTSSLVYTFDLGVNGLSSLAFGGPNRDILYVLAKVEIIDPFSGEVTERVTNGTSLYEIRGLGTGFPSTRLKLH